jgi:S1-C subfamily serine protease
MMDSERNMKDGTSLASWSDARARVVSSVEPSIASIAIGRSRYLSGIAWDKEYVLTAAEPIAGADTASVNFGAAQSTAEVVATDLTTDVAVLRVPGHTAPALKPSARAQGAGSIVALVGRGARGPCAAWGGIALAGPAWRSRRGGALARRLEFDVRFTQGLEGAAAVDAAGGLIAMAVSGAGGRVLGIPSETLQRVLTLVDQHGHVPQPYLGLRLQPLWLDEAAASSFGGGASGTAVIAGIDPNSPAAGADVALGDLLLGIDGQRLTGIPAVAAHLASAAPGATLTLDVLRAGTPRSAEIRVGERPRR